MKKKITSKSKQRGAKRSQGSLISSKRLSKTHLVVFALIFAAIGSYLVWNSLAASGPPKPFVDIPQRGLIWAGLKAPQAGGPCGHLYELANTHNRVPMCTHGPDPAPEGVDVSKSVEPIGNAQDTAAAGTAATDYPPIPCDGDGSSGNRVQGLYVRASDVASRFSTYASSFQAYARRANNMYAVSAQETGGIRNIRWVHDSNCNPIIPEVVIPPIGDDDFNNTITELQKLGYNRTDRKYMLWVDANVYCGIGTIYADDDPSSNNINNGRYNSYGRSDSGCWNYSEAHELMHNLGGVQSSAPHATPGWHCTDERDEMCYVDGSGVVLTYPCSAASGINFDCNHDDYYYAGTAPTGNYLFDHWNTANSSFLMGGGLPPVLVQCNNGVDDDNDARVDYSADLGCSSASDTSESPDPPPPADTTAPTVSIVQPSSNATVRRTIGIYANGGDNVRVTKMEILIDNLVRVTTNGTPIAYSWNTSKAPKTSHAITVKAYDAAGNVGQNSITVYVTK